MGNDMFTIEFYVDAAGRSPVERWITRDLTTTQVAALRAALRVVLARHGIAVCGSEWGKQLGGGLFEFRIRHTAAEVSRMPGGGKGAVLLRVFCHAYGDRVVLLLGGYDKGSDSSPKRQRAEIERARKRLADWKRRSR